MNLCPECDAKIEDIQEYCHKCGFPVLEDRIRKAMDVWTEATKRKKKQQKIEYGGGAYSW